METWPPEPQGTTLNPTVSHGTSRSPNGAGPYDVCCLLGHGAFVLQACTSTVRYKYLWPVPVQYTLVQWECSKFSIHQQHTVILFNHGIDFQAMIPPKIYPSEATGSASLGKQTLKASLCVKKVYWLLCRELRTPPIRYHTTYLSSRRVHV